MCFNHPETIAPRSRPLQSVDRLSSTKQIGPWCQKGWGPLPRLNLWQIPAYKCVCVYACLYICIYVYKHVYLYSHIHIIYTYMHMYLYVCMLNHA